MPDEFEYSGPPIQWTLAGADETAQAENLEQVESSPGFEHAQQLVFDAVARLALTTVLDYTSKAVQKRFQADGIWHKMPPMDRESGDAMLATLKQMAGLNDKERRAKQEGSFTALIRKTKYKVRLVSQGVKTGERVAVYLDWKRSFPETLEELGMRPSAFDQLTNTLRSPDLGLFLVTARPGEGFTSAWRGVMNACDRLVRDYYVIEDASNVEPDIINVKSLTFDNEAGETAMTPIPDLLLKEPDVLAFTDLPDGKTIDNVVNLSRDHELPVFTRIPGKGAIDATLRMMMMKPDRKKFVQSLTGVVCMRLVRKLCVKCRIAFKPHPSLLQKLGLPPGRIAQLYKPCVYRPGMMDEDGNEVQPCKQCCGIGYQGRTGIVEFLTINNELRQAMISKPKLETLSAIAAENGHVSLKQEGLVLVAKGTTSLEELQRVLKG
jgi:type II secretory ATPase GspE/PulE/Tfp pilus assembly ATPase PilB-like protein